MSQKRGHCLPSLAVMLVLTRDGEEDVVHRLEGGTPLPVQRHPHEHQPLRVERGPAEEEGKHHHH